MILAQLTIHFQLFPFVIWHISSYQQVRTFSVLEVGGRREAENRTVCCSIKVSESLFSPQTFLQALQEVFCYANTYENRQTAAKIFFGRKSGKVELRKGHFHASDIIAPSSSFPIYHCASGMMKKEHSMAYVFFY